MSHIEDKDLPKYLTLGEYTYTFKAKKVNYNYAYRCKNRKCGVIININEENIVKILKKEKNTKIEYQKVSSKEHSCDKNDKSINIKDVNTSSEDYALASDIIKNNLDKSLEWHIQNLQNNRIILTRNQIKGILQKFRDVNFPKDDIYLNDLSKIKIDISSTNINLKNLNYCYGKLIVVNKKKDRQEILVLFTSIIQIKQFADCNVIFMDGTFKSCPKGFYQIYNILGRDVTTGVIIPLFHILMSKKSYDSYYYIFSFIKSIFANYSLIIDFKKMYFMLDFEKASRKALKDNFPEADIKGCYYHYAKALWAKAKKYGLTRKIIAFETYTLIFSFKIYQFIPVKDKNDYLNEIYTIYADKQEYKKFIKYFTKNWKNCNFLDFEELDKDQIKERTDNVSENFNKNLNKLICRPHPKVSYLVEKLKEYTVKQYNSLIESRILKNEKEPTGYNIYSDIFNFIIKAKEKYKKNLSINMINDFNNDDMANLRNICIKLIKEILDINIDEDKIDSKDNLNIEIEDSIGEEEDIQIIGNENILKDEDEDDKENSNGEEIDDIKKESHNLFDIEVKQKKRGKKTEFTDFYMINEDLF